MVSQVMVGQGRSQEVGWVSSVKRCAGNLVLATGGAIGVAVIGTASKWTVDMGWRGAPEADSLEKVFQVADTVLRAAYSGAEWLAVAAGDNTRVIGAVALGGTAGLVGIPCFQTLEDLNRRDLSYCKKAQMIALLPVRFTVAFGLGLAAIKVYNPDIRLF